MKCIILKFELETIAKLPVTILKNYYIRDVFKKKFLNIIEFKMEKIGEILDDLAKKNDITIIYAVESGSRAWSFESTDSDYDIRFVFIYNDRKKYLSLKPLKDSIDGFSDDRIYDWNGWDIRKALKHIHEMNPSITEWLFSPIVYHKNDKYNFVEQSKKLLAEQKRITPLIHHYRSMAKSNYKKHIDNKSMVNIKKYLYVIRPAGMVEWLLKCNKDGNKIVEIDFNVVLNDLKSHLSTECYENIIDIIKKKKLVKELDEEPRVKCLDEWLENIINNSTVDNNNNNETTTDGNKQKQSLDDYDEFLHEILEIKF